MKRLILDRTIAGLNYSVKEMTVDEVRVWLLRMGSAYTAPHPKSPGLLKKLAIFCGFVDGGPARSHEVVDALLFEDLTMLDLSILTTLTREQIGTLTPSQVREVWKDCQEVNADFFQFRHRLETIGMASQQMPSAISNVLSPD